jgi:hypothetical protein
MVAGGGHAVVAGDADGWPWLVAGLAVGALATSGIQRLLVDRRERDHSASGDDAVAPSPAPSPAPTTLRRGAWCLSVISLLWAAMASLLTWSLPSFSRTGSAAFGVATFSLALAAFFVGMPAAAIRPLLRGDLAAAGRGSISAVFLVLWALVYIGNDWAGGSNVRAAAALAVAGVAGGLALALERVERNAPGAGGDAENRTG